MNKIKCIPLCCLGMKVESLPSPINQFQACNLNREQLTDLYNEVAKLKNESNRDIEEYDFESLLEQNNMVDKQFAEEIEDLLPDIGKKINMANYTESENIKVVNNSLSQTDFERLKKILRENQKLNIELQVKNKFMLPGHLDEFFINFDMLINKNDKKVYIKKYNSLVIKLISLIL